MKSIRSADGTASLEKALDLLDVVGRAARGIGQAELAERLALPRTTMYRLLGTLVERGLLRRDPQRRLYGIGMRCFEYARAAQAVPDLAVAASPELRAIRDLTGETTYLAVRDGHAVLLLERYDGAHSLRSQGALGRRTPLYCTSQGKAILSALDPVERESLLKALELVPLTANTLTDRRRLRAELHVTAARGWALDDEEIATGVRCCGAPIVDASGRVHGAISVAGPAFRMTRARIELIGPEVVGAARRVAAQLPFTEHTQAIGPVRAVEGEWAFSGAFPQWLPIARRLVWADVLAPAIHEVTEDGDRCALRLEAPVEAFLRLADESLRIRVDGRWFAVDSQGGVQTCHDMPRRSMTAWCADSDGVPWLCLAEGESWRVGPWAGRGQAGTGWLLSRPVSALAWSPGLDALYAIDSDSSELIVMRPGVGAVRRFAGLSKASGRPVALAVDRQGGVWVAMRDGWSVVRHASDGRLDRIVGLPVPTPTGLSIGGAEGGKLYVTSERESLTLDALANAPLAGRLFEIDLGLSGHPD
jgi:DNA-binding IclR family transcriptional regulator/sugar lactone lactonase YvrE